MNQSRNIIQFLNIRDLTRFFEQQESSSCCKYQKFKCSISIECIFAIIAKRRYIDRAKMQFHFRHRLRQFFLSMTSSFERSSQIHCCIASRAKDIQRSSNEIQKFFSVRAETNRQNIEIVSLCARLCERYCNFFKNHERAFWTFTRCFSYFEEK